MKRFLGLLIVSLFFAIPMLMAQENNRDHAEIGAFVDYFRLTNPAPTKNYFGLGGRAAFNLTANTQLEAEMAYDFKQNYTNTYHNGVSSTTVTSSLRTLHGFFGPKFQTGSGAFRVFFTGKVGFDNLNITNQNASSGFTNAVGLGNGATYFAVYPGAGFEAFAGPIGLRAEIGDDIFFNNGAHNNMRVSLGPQFRF